MFVNMQMYIWKEGKFSGANIYNIAYGSFKSFISLLIFYLLDILISEKGFALWSECVCPHQIHMLKPNA